MSGFLIGPCGVAPAASAWTPASFGANLMAWFKDPDVNTNTNVSGTNVTQWNDSSGNGYTITPSATTPPVYQAAGLNGKPAVIFTAANADRLISAASVTWGTGAAGAGFMLGSFTANSVAGGGLGTVDTAKRSFVGADGAAPGIQVNQNFGSGAVQTAAINTVLRMGGVFDGSAGLTYVNNVANSTPFSNSVIFTNTTQVGFNLAANTSCYDGPVREFFFINRAPTAPERASIDAYLASRA